MRRRDGSYSRSSPLVVVSQAPNNRRRNDFMRETMRYFRSCAKNDSSCDGSSGEFHSAELGEELGRYAERKAARAQSGSDQRRGVANYDEWWSP